jgi:hypothetical protein
MCEEGAEEENTTEYESATEQMQDGPGLEDSEESSVAEGYLEPVTDSVSSENSSRSLGWDSGDHAEYDKALNGGVAVPAVKGSSGKSRRAERRERREMVGQHNEEVRRKEERQRAREREKKQHRQDPEQGKMEDMRKKLRELQEEVEGLESQLVEAVVGFTMGDAEVWSRGTQFGGVLSTKEVASQAQVKKGLGADKGVQAVASTGNKKVGETVVQQEARVQCGGMEVVTAVAAVQCKEQGRDAGVQCQVGQVMGQETVGVQCGLGAGDGVVMVETAAAMAAQAVQKKEVEWQHKLQQRMGTWKWEVGMVRKILGMRREGVFKQVLQTCSEGDYEVFNRVGHKYGL